MLRRMFIVGILAGLVLAVAPIGAHEQFRIIGTVTAKKAKDLSVKTKEGRTVSMTLDGYTRVTRDKKKVSLDEVKVGQSVVVDAIGDTMDDLTVMDVRIVPALTKR